MWFEMFKLKQESILCFYYMGYDAYGLPAEQYAIQTGQHPAITTEVNLARYREQMDKIGFSFDWDREVRTCDPDYYKWTQWTFIQLFHSWFDKDLQKAQPISRLVEVFEKEGNAGVHEKSISFIHSFSDSCRSGSIAKPANRKK